MRTLVRSATAWNHRRAFLIVGIIVVGFQFPGFTPSLIGITCHCDEPLIRKPAH